MRHPRQALALAAAAALTTVTPGQAHACGGFFCNNTAPVAQSGENILFGIESDGTLSTHIQIFYSGPSDRFAWILPLPSVPTSVDVGTDQLFEAMDRATRPQFQVVARTEGTCRAQPSCEFPDAGPWWSGGADAATPADAGASDPTVHFRGEVGPYDAVVLEAGTVEELTTWLRDNGFDIPTTADPLLADYVAARHVFVAIRLLSDRDTGEIQPLVLRYAEGQPCVPIRLTSIAATLDMPITAYFLGRALVASDNYSAVEPTYDDVRLWTDPSAYRTYVSNAIDDAGGRGFVTEYAGGTPGGIDLRVPSTTGWGRPATPFELFQILAGYRSEPALMSLLQRFVPVPEGRDAQSYYNCLAARLDASGCGYVDGSMDVEGLFTAIEDQIVRPRREATEMIARHPRTTRLFTTMSPEEMTIDPTFRLDDGLPDVSNVHTATRVFECSAGYVEGDAPTRLELPSGTVGDRTEGIAFTDDATWCARRGGWVPGSTPAGDGGAMDGGVGTGSMGGGGGCAVSRGAGRSGSACAILAIIAIAVARRRRTSTEQGA